MAEYQQPWYPPPQKKTTNPWMIIGWIMLAFFCLFGAGCAAIVGITALGASSGSTRTTVTR